MVIYPKLVSLAGRALFRSLYAITRPSISGQSFGVEVEILLSGKLGDGMQIRGYAEFGTGCGWSMQRE